MEKARVWAILFRMSTESSIMLKTPFEAKEFKEDNADHQLQAGEWCLRQMGGAWLPVMFICGRQDEAEEIKQELLAKMQEDGESS